jgi:hypothetical protein
LILAGLAVTTIAAAQQIRTSRTFQMKAPPVSAPVALLRSVGVQQELRVSADQWKRISGLLPKETSPIATSTGTFTFSDNSEADAKSYDQVRKVLSPGQVERLEQIHRQKFNLHSLTYPPYRIALGATPEQVDRIEAARSQIVQKALGAMPPPSADGKVHSIRIDTKRLEPQLEAQAKKILTPAQWRKWQTMLGKPFAAANR